ncbi:MAG: precorrin-6y C5,15-methyltransferase (decarboxylating) subunit CbiE [Oscillospiraceae bacterium]|nr:precorrin-6y C5,15-methyltransferase (decarboxylating) subunit CbiE [Oscillospiraceae bacterium]
MKLTLIGCGCGRGTLSLEARAAIEQAQMLVGAPRLLEEFPEVAERKPARSAKEILEALQQADSRDTAVLFSGDSGFYSGAGTLFYQLEGEAPVLLPGISSLQVLSARLKEPWQDWKLCSAHGKDCDPTAAVCEGKPVFFLTGGKLGPAELCARLKEDGLGFLRTAAGENMGTQEEQIRLGNVEEFAEQYFAPLSVLLVRPAPRCPRKCPGFPDEAFLREDGIPMTKQEVRSVILAKLNPDPEETCWDIGTGTGSVAVELAMQAKRVFSVERDDKALALAERNRRQFGAWNLRLIHGTAPGALNGLPAPDAVFIGGSSGNLSGIVQAICAANPNARICVSAVTLETLQEATPALKDLGFETEVLQLSVSRSRRAGDLTMMTAQNPVFLITGKRG